VVKKVLIRVKPGSHHFLGKYKLDIDIDVRAYYFPGLISAMSDTYRFTGALPAFDERECLNGRGAPLKGIYL